MSLTALLDKNLENIAENSVLAITSKVVSLCENRVVQKAGIDKAELVKREAQYYLPGQFANRKYQLTITNDTLIPMAGIDESNGDCNYILWPADPQKTADEVRQYLIKKFGLQHIGVIITDSACTPLRFGTTGVALSHSGFQALHSYVGEPDLFGNPQKVSRTNVAGGLAACAVLVMGEGAEQTPLALLADLPFVTFQNHEPTGEELAALRVPRQEDLFATFLDSASWQKGANGTSDHKKSNP